MNKTNFLVCTCCGKSYRISALSDSDFCTDCTDRSPEPYDREYEADVIQLTNPAGKTPAVYIE